MPRTPPDQEPWYVAAFEADYLERYAHRDEASARAEGPFLSRALSLPAGGRVLDLCCGAGRHSRTLAAAGLRVLGVDLSLALLRRARAEAPGIPVLRADMRALPLAGASLDGAVNLFTSFGYFESDAENARALNEVARVLRPGGRFVIDFLNLPRTLANLQPHNERTSGNDRIVEHRRYDAIRRRLVKDVTVYKNDGAVRKRLVESVRAFAPDELIALLEQSGLRVLERCGDLAGAVFSGTDSPRCVLVAERPR